MQLRRDLDQTDGITADIREAQGKAFQAWDKELNREYRELMAVLDEKDRANLREAQKAWLAFRAVEEKLWWSKISADGTMQSIVVSDIGTQFLKERVCRLSRYRSAAAIW